MSSVSKRMYDGERLKQIEEKMQQKGFTIKEDNNEDDDLAFEYESDSVEKYKMISNEFDYEAIKESPKF